MTGAEFLAACVGLPEWPSVTAAHHAGLAAIELGYDAVSGRGRRQAGRLYLGAALAWFEARIRESGGSGADVRGLLATMAESIRAAIDAGRAVSTRRHPGPGPEPPGPSPAGPKFDEVRRAAAVLYAVEVLGHAMWVSAAIGCPVADVERILLSRCGELDRAEGL